MITIKATNGVVPDATQMLTVRMRPSVTSVSPISGPFSGGTPITITGTGFLTGASVVIGQGAGAGAGAGAIVAIDVTVVSSTEIMAVTGGPAKAGQRNLYVTSGGVTSAANSGDRFNYNKPTITSVSPNSGPRSGGTPVTITGTGFVPGADVVIGQGAGAGVGAIPATDVMVVSSTEITATTGGPAKAGRWNLYVTSGGVTSAANSGDVFTYN